MGSTVTLCNDKGKYSAVVSGTDPSDISDNCPGPITVTYILSGATTGSGSGSASGVTFNKGTTAVTYTATDTSLNSAGCVFTVTVNDCEPPQVTCSVAPGTVATQPCADRCRVQGQRSG